LRHWFTAGAVRVSKRTREKEQNLQLA